MHDPEVWKQENTFSYTFGYDHADVTVRIDGETVERVAELLRKPPQTEFEAALECFQRRHYPNSKHLPWVKHRKLDGDDKENKIKTATQNTWPMAWYWKAVLPTLQYWDDSCKDRWLVKISQIRQWVMVLVYEELDTGQSRLLRPPLFGPSQRILQDDQYWLLLAFQKEIKDAWIESKSKTEYERIHVLGRHDVLYRIHGFFEGETSNEITVKLQSSLILNPQVIKMPKTPQPNIKQDEPLPTIMKMLIPPGKEKPQTEDTLKLVEGISSPYPLLTIPAQLNNPDVKKSVSLLLSSDRVCEAVAALSEVWNDPTAKSILIHAPPGSGKEILAKTIYDFRAFGGPYVPFALSPDPTLAESNQRMLYFRDMNDAEAAGEVVGMIRGELDEESKIEQSISDGLVFKARKGVLFLDEIDKEEEGKTRAGLLRLLENDEFAVFDTTLTVKIPKSQLPTYVFAASIKTLRDVLKLHPPDFWTRISHFIEMQHPLSGASEEEQKQIFADYFHMFWNQHIPKFFRKGGLLPYPDISVKTTDGGKISIPFIHNYTAMLFWVLMNLDVTLLFSNRFAELILQHRIADEISVRNIRSVVGRVVFSLVDLLLYDKDFEKPLAEIRKRLAEVSSTDTIKIHWGEVLVRIITAREFISSDNKLFSQKSDDTAEKRISSFDVNEFCENVNLQIRKLPREIDGIIHAAINTLPSL